MADLSTPEGKLVERLREYGARFPHGSSGPSLANEAADALSRIAAERDEARADAEKFHAIAEDKLADTRLVSAGPRGEGFGFDLMGGPIPYLAEYLFQFIGARDKEEPSNYAEIEVNHHEFGGMTLTLQRHSGKTPHQLRQAAERERDELKAEVERLREALMPFAAESSQWEGYEDGEFLVEPFPGITDSKVTVGALRRARAALRTPEESP